MHLIEQLQAQVSIDMNIIKSYDHLDHKYCEGCISLIVILCAGSTTINLFKWQSKPCYEKSYYWKILPGTGFFKNFYQPRVSIMNQGVGETVYHISNTMTRLSGLDIC